MFEKADQFCGEGAGLIERDKQQREGFEHRQNNRKEQNHRGDGQVAFVGEFGDGTEDPFGLEREDDVTEIFDVFVHDDHQNRSDQPVDQRDQSRQREQPRLQARREDEAAQKRQQR